MPSGIRKFLSRPSEPVLDPKTVLLRYFLIGILVLTGIFHIRSAFLFQIAQNQGASMAAYSHSLSHPDALVNLAREEHFRDADLAAALSLYKKALTNFVLHLPAWLGITEVLNDQGHEMEAKDSLSFIHSHFGNNESITWSKALLADTLGQEQILTENLVWLANNYPNKKDDVFSLATLTWDSPEVIMEKFGKNFYPDILQEYIKNDELEKTLPVWKNIVETGSMQQKPVLRYIDYLVSQNAFSLATKVWLEFTGPDTPLLYNGSFEQPPLESAFGWRITKPKGVSWKTGEYGSGLEISFDGSENVSFQLSQRVPLNPGKYVLTGTVETDNLTTDQLPFWTIQGVQCSGLSAGSEMVLPNQHGVEFILPFTMPDTCELANIALVRRPSYHFDNKIGGKVTVNNLALIREGTMGSGRRLDTRQSTTQSPDKPTNISINKLQTQQ